MTTISDHPLRYALANELHARPFPMLAAPCRAVFLAVKKQKDAASRDKSQDRDHLLALLDRYGAPHPQPGATHWSGQIGKHILKWEQHTEFMTFTVFLEGLGERPFDPADFEVFPEGWLNDAPGVRVTSAMVRIEPEGSPEEMQRKCDDWFVAESMAISTVLDNAATIAGDFRIDPAGHMRFVIFPAEHTGERRIGRILQRLCEIETYKSMSMLGLARVRAMSDQLGEVDARLTRLMSDMSSATHDKPEETLHSLLTISAELESLQTQAAFRFGATGAYEAIVNQRIEVLREARVWGRQTFAEFMMRRYDPAMRTVKSTERRLATMSDRAIRAAQLLQTRVDVDRSAQNQALLESMDRRADLQLRLQETVEGLSVVAISYYAVSLATYLLAPVGKLVHLEKTELTALVTLPVVVIVYLMIRRIRNQVH
ncbi:DUF3422 family protein [Donghicola eburneus]|uniref:Putative membrane protein n=1 Tax=Donghicola eburneus TaxID=393278 RepID=A0A1M4N165_9RHOB|nr:DUF3422 domain-containing protein [Donghicola eburneus]SCM68529.1 putative membrane protein [Donghicola eburneus]SFQ26519.1 Uncharacterized membrane-anchored protein [Donghicola eburneus]